jgi:cyclophilin family peptidyl-prolyl cis-trans isomerase/HEAT repeat protein
VLAAGCSAGRPPVATPEAVRPDQKLSWILQLEDQRVLRVEPPPAPAAPASPRSRTAAPAPVVLPDLTVLIKDADARIRRRAALAIGRTRLAGGMQPLTAALADADPDVRAMAAFALGLIGDPSAAAGLTPLLADPSPVVRGRAAQALGLIGAKDAAPAIGRLAAEYVRSAPVASMTTDAEPWPAPPEADAFRLAVCALVRLEAYEPLAAAVLDGDRPITTWWPVAYALQRIGDPRAALALMQLLQVQGTYAPAFAARGLGSIKHRPAVVRLLPFLDPRTKAPLGVVVSAIRALGAIGDEAAVTPLVDLVLQREVPPNVRLEAVTALGQLGSADGLPVVQDLMTDPWTAMRAAAYRAAAQIDPETFMLVLAGVEPDSDWRVRAAVAEVLGTIEGDAARDRLRRMAADQDKRVVSAVLAALAASKAPDAGAVLLERLGDPDFVVRAAAARGIGALKPAGGADALRAAYEAARPDAAYGARAAILDALVAYGATEARPTLEAALADKDWAVRVHAADLLHTIDPAADAAARIRPVPGTPVTPYDDPQLVSPELSPHVFIETARGTIEFELAVLDAPQTTRNFMALARKGFFNGLPIHRVVPNFVVQDGDPRGDGEGGPGYTIRDELNDRPFLRGTVGMALDWRDTGGSQFFITHSPQPHLDARYTVFGHVVHGMEVVDAIQQGDVIERLRVWDGTGWQE